MRGVRYDDGVGGGEECLPEVAQEEEVDVVWVGVPVWVDHGAEEGFFEEGAAGGVGGCEEVGPGCDAERHSSRWSFCDLLFFISSTIDSRF